MAVQVVRPKGVGALLINSHPTGCERSVLDLADEVGEGSPAGGRSPVALIIGSSAGYGLAMTVAGIVGCGISGIGLGFERPAAARRTATAGWYRVRALADLAHRRGTTFRFLSEDCFLEETKRRVLDEVKTRFGQVDYLIYSVAAPRRTDPRTGTTYQSVVKPLGSAHVTKHVSFDSFDDDSQPAVSEVEVAPATEPERLATVKVMGGEDWADWVTALASEGLLADGFRTVALSYIGSELTAEIYRRGTIGSAKDHLERTAHDLTSGVLADRGGAAITSVNGATVTQASMAIPGIALYVSLLRSVLGDGLVSPVRQSVQLWEHLTRQREAPVDELGRLRLDYWELDPAVQAAVQQKWDAIKPGAPLPIDALRWFRQEFLRLYGFGMDSVDYDLPVEADLPWPEPPY